MHSDSATRDIVSTAKAITSVQLRQRIVALAQGASIEANVQDMPHLEKARQFIAGGTRVFVSHLPKQSWQQTIDACAAVSSAGLSPIPHIPVRLLESESSFNRLLAALRVQAGIEEVLVISGDYPTPLGPYSSVADVLPNAPFAQFGITNLSFAGHPEGHPKVPLATIREAEWSKCNWASSNGIRTRTVTQFFFESAPFIEWASDQAQRGVITDRIAGLAGPASIATLFRYALRCGVGPSLRALGVRPGSLLKLMGDHGPERLIVELATAQAHEPTLLAGLHVFCFGGFIRTSEWLHAIANDRFDLDPAKGFRVTL